MKVYRKNRSQSAKQFMISDKMILGFLVGQDGTVQFIETLTGEIKRISVSGSKGIETTTLLLEEKFEQRDNVSGEQAETDGWVWWKSSDGMRHGVRCNGTIDQPVRPERQVKSIEERPIGNNKFTRRVTYKDGKVIERDYTFKKQK